MPGAGHPEECSRHLLATKHMKFRFIEDHRDETQVKLVGKVLDVSCSGYYGWRTRPPSAREMANQELSEQIKTVYDEGLRTYGSPRIYDEIKDQGVARSENRIARLMRLRARQTKRYRTTTKRNKADRAAANLLKGDFTADRRAAAGARRELRGSEGEGVCCGPVVATPVIQGATGTVCGN